MVLVDDTGRQIGIEEKLAAHRAPGLLHRAISAFVYDRRGRLLLQQRAAGKYHFAGLWGNTMCSHPAPGEGVVAAGHRRLHEEMGLCVALREVGTFSYRALDPASGLIEHEFDHALVGVSDAEPRLDPAEADDWRRIEPAELWARIQAGEAGFAPWLRLALQALPSLRSAPL